MTSLFRPEAVQNRQREWLGSIQLLQPVTLRCLTGCVVGVAIALVLFMAFGQYTRKARVCGYLVAERGLIRLVAPESAVVVESRAIEGLPVRRGDVMFVLALGEAVPNGIEPQILVRAPQDGVVTAVAVDPGQGVAAATVLASVLPDGAKLQAHLFASASAIGLLRPHQTVLLRYQAFPYQKFGHQTGEILQVSRSPLPAAALAELPPQPARNQPLYRITVALPAQSVAAYGQAQPLAPGMQIDADILLERRRLIDWLFEPALGRAGTV